MAHAKCLARLPYKAIRTQDLNHLCKTQRLYTTTAALHETASSALPRVARPSFWASLIPKPFRRNTSPNAELSRPRQRNPMTPYILLGILVGSNAINLIALRNEMVNFSRKTDAKLALLREVIQKVKNGEDVDVKRALGTGNPQDEAEWEEMVKELEETDMLWEGRKKREARRQEKWAVQQQLDRERAVERSRLKKEWAEYREGSGRKPQKSEDAAKQQEQEQEQEQRQRRPKFLM